MKKIKSLNKMADARWRIETMVRRLYIISTTYETLILIESKLGYKFLNTKYNKILGNCFD